MPECRTNNLLLTIAQRNYAMLASRSCAIVVLSVVRSEYKKDLFSGKNAARSPVAFWPCSCAVNLPAYLSAAISKTLIRVDRPNEYFFPTLFVQDSLTVTIGYDGVRDPVVTVPVPDEKLSRSLTATHLNATITRVSRLRIQLFFTLSDG